MPVNPEHADMLTTSGISAERAAARGYRTVTDRRELAALPIHTGETVAIVKPGRVVPGLLIPLRSIDGEIRSYQYRPDNPRLDRDGRPIKYESVWEQPVILDVPPGLSPRVTDPDETLWITEGSKKADAGAEAGLCIVSLAGVWCWMTKNSAGASLALPEFRDVPWKGPNGRRRVVLGFDGDVARKESVQKALHALAQYLSYRGARVEYLWLPDTAEKTGLDDYLASHSVDELKALVKPTKPPPAQSRDNTADDRQPAEPKPEPAEPVAIAKLHERCLHWFGQHYDLDAIDVTLATAAAERLDGDPLWLLIISGPGAAKTETIITLKDCDDKTVVTSTITSLGALLSATSRRERAKDATGGLLKTLEPRGLLILKDVTSILSIPPGPRGLILSALREVFDGHYVREAGVDGGRRIPWTGRIGVLGAVTTAWDRAHAVIAEMGDRFVLLRIDSTENRIDSGQHAIDNTGSETEMRAELNRLARGVIAGIDITKAPKLTDDEASRILKAADLVTLARTAVDHDYRGDVIDSHAPEMPTRFAKQLTQVFRGAVLVGIDRENAIRLAIRCARDSMPPLRLEIIDELAKHPGSTTNEVRKELDKPRNTVDRQLQALHILGAVTVDETTAAWTYSLAPHIDPQCLICPGLYKRTTDTKEEGAGRRQEENEEEGSEGLFRPPGYISGQPSDNGEVRRCACGAALDTDESLRRGNCNACFLTGKSKSKPAAPTEHRCLECGRYPSQGHAPDCPANKWKRPR